MSDEFSAAIEVLRTYRGLAQRGVWARFRRFAVVSRSGLKAIAHNARPERKCTGSQTSSDGSSSSGTVGAPGRIQESRLIALGELKSRESGVNPWTAMSVIPRKTEWMCLRWPMTATCEDWVEMIDPDVSRAQRDYRHARAVAPV
jgi:hypothetical protein